MTSLIVNRSGIIPDIQTAEGMLLLVGNEDRDRGLHYSLTCQDSLSKYLAVVHIKKQDADSCCKSFGRTCTISGLNFMSEVMKHTYQLLQVKRICTSRYHPQSKFVERSHRTLVKYLRRISQNLNNWDTWIPYATFVFNTTPHSSTGNSPHTIFRRSPNIPGMLRKVPTGLYE
ncbi:hypothetical protein PR048_015412 [Dryococelus australis]|uniref:Integrase catalytic domain-containing protein n=1 Tax=Dryococelus australis TaxID=614101 RepID=A0ABQ9HHW8_9NEOP|nr:hypothetical protein PR048_015412 [Dryococelus australis]